MTRFLAFLRRFRARRLSKTKTPSALATNPPPPNPEGQRDGPRPLNELRAAIRQASERDRELQLSLTNHARLLDQFEALDSDEAILVTSVFSGDHLNRETTRHNMRRQEEQARSKVIYKYIAFQDARLDGLQALVKCVTAGEVTVEQLRKYETLGAIPREITEEATATAM